jgi:ABC-type glycerol-3-phosphate transport system permease component
MLTEKTAKTRIPGPSPRTVAPRHGLSGRSRRRVRRGALYFALLAATAIAVGPLYYIVRTSVESDQGYTSGRADLSLSSWSAVFGSTQLVSDMLHSVIVTASAIAMILVVSCMGGYGFAVLRPRHSAPVFAGLVAAFMIPVQSIVVPLYFDSAHLDLIGHYYGVILVYTATGVPFSMFLMTSFLQGVPSELIEAGLIDGLGYVGVLCRILPRIMVPAVVTVGIIQFINIWNDLLFALLWLPTSGNRTITVGLATIQSSVNGRVTPVPEIMAAAALEAVPAVVLFSFLQRYLLRGLTAGVNR